MRHLARSLVVIALLVACIGSTATAQSLATDAIIEVDVTGPMIFDDADLMILAAREPRPHVLVRRVHRTADCERRARARARGLVPTVRWLLSL